MTVRVVVTGATGQVAYALLPRIAAGEMFGHDTDVDLRLSDIPPVIEKAKGVVMELEDGAYPLLAQVTASSDRTSRIWDVRRQISRALGGHQDEVLFAAPRGDRVIAVDHFDMIAAHPDDLPRGELARNRLPEPLLPAAPTLPQTCSDRSR